MEDFYHSNWEVINLNDNASISGSIGIFENNMICEYRNVVVKRL